MENREKKDKRVFLFFLIAMILGTGLLLYRVPVGIARDDESFYATIPYRMVQGDALLTDE